MYIFSNEFDIKKDVTILFLQMPDSISPKKTQI